MNSNPRAEAQALEQAGDIPAALVAYERALAATPDDAELLADLGRLAGRMGQHALAEAFWRQLLLRQPQRLEAVDGLTRALRDQHRYAEAIEVIRPAIQAHPDDARLWNTLGAVVQQQGDSRTALTFFDEAVRLAPGLAVARFNRGGARMDLNALDAARTDLDAALDLATEPHERAMIAFSRAPVRLAQGDLAGGWALYEARLAPELSAPVFEAPGRRWSPGTPLAGRRLLVLAEQGLGDEAMFAGVLPDVLGALGPDGQLAVAVEPRLVSLFARSFPEAQVTAHATRREGPRLVRSAPGVEAVELWTPMASLLQSFRPSLASFPRRPYLKPDPARIAHWQAWLAEAGGGARLAGLTWRSGKLAGERRRQYPALEDWAPVLATPGLRFVNLQYGAEPEELEALARMAGARLLAPPGIDLRADLDDLAALASALGHVVAIPNATAALAAASGVETWMVDTPAAWPRLGTDGYPWYAQARSFTAEAFGAFALALSRLAQELT